MLDEVLYKLNETAEKFICVGQSSPAKSAWEKFIEKGRFDKGVYNNPEGIFKDLENKLKNGHDSALDNWLDIIPWMKIGHFFADISVVVSLSFLIWYCYAVMIGTKGKREQCAQKIYISMIVVFITKCVEVLTRGK